MFMVSAWEKERGGQGRQIEWKYKLYSNERTRTRCAIDIWAHWMWPTLLWLLLLHVMCVRVKQFLLVQLITFVLSSDISKKPTNFCLATFKVLMRGHSQTQAIAPNAHTHSHQSRGWNYKKYIITLYRLSAIRLPWVSFNFSFFCSHISGHHVFKRYGLIHLKSNIHFDFIRTECMKWFE